MLMEKKSLVSDYCPMPAQKLTPQMPFKFWGKFDGENRRRTWDNAKMKGEIIKMDEFIEKTNFTFSDFDCFENGSDFDPFKEASENFSTKIEKAFIELEDSLYSPINSLNKSDEFEDIHNNFRNPTVGYDAHVQPVDTKELNLWKRNFPYLRVTGTNILKCDDDDNKVLDNIKEISEIIYNRNCNFEHVDTNSTDLTDLVVYGQNIPIVSNVQDKMEVDDDQDSVEIVDGILEEIIAIDMIDDSSHNEDELDSINPEIVKKTELVDALVDCIWPDIIDTLGPLIEDIYETVI